VLWERVAFGAPTRKAAHVRRLGDRLLRRQLVFRRTRFELFEDERQLINQPCRAFRFLPVDLALQFRDPQSLSRDQRRIFRGFRTRYRQLRGNLHSFHALGDQRRLQGDNVLGQGLRSAIHETKRIIVFAICGAPKCARLHIFRLSRSRRPPRQLRIAPIDSLEHVRHLRR
jgi:hypothetical protein